MNLRLYDTLTREKRVFTPIDPQNVRMYVCGPTVYDFAHIGNARPVIVFDVLFRLLRHVYGADHVTYVRNITDVDDKINDRALRDYPGLPLNEAIRKVTEKTADQFQADVTALGCLPPTHQPRATEFVLPRPDGKADMVTLIEQLLKKQHAYPAAGEVLFDTQSMLDYGALSGRNLEEQQAGARVAVDAHKKHPNDFVLWKQSALDEPGWESPWGRGRPGWHIECSAMSAAYLGTTFDIHGGGLDLIFPHHENEIAQSRCAHGTTTLANYWMHNGFVQVEGQKMSKSLGNFRTISDLRSDWQGQVIRYQMLMSHYRQPLDWTGSASREAQFIVDRWYEFFREAQDLNDCSEVDAGVLESLSDDLNTHEALQRLSALFDQARRDIVSARLFVGSARFLGFFQRTPEDYFSFYEEVAGLVPQSSPLVPIELQKLRDKVRADRDFEKSDYLRNLIYLYGYRAIDSSNNQSELVPARKDFFSITPGTKGRLAVAVRVAMANDSSEGQAPSLERGFTAKFGQIFQHSLEFYNSVSDAYSDLSRELGVGAITEEDLRGTIIDVVLSNRAEPAKFGPDVVADAVLFKLFSGVIAAYDVYFDNHIISTAENIDWQMGDVTVTSSAVLSSILPEHAPERARKILLSDAMAGSLFNVRIASSSTAIKNRSLTLIRAFITSTRFLMYQLQKDGMPQMPLIGMLEQSVERSETGAMRLAKSIDGTLIFPGSKHRFPYALSADFIQSAKRLPLYKSLSRIISLDLFAPTVRELLALDRLSRARSSEDPFARLLWNIEAVETFCGIGEPSSQDLRGVIETRISSLALNPKDLKSLLRLADRFSRLRTRPGFVGDADASAAQSFAEQIILGLLMTESKYI